MALFHVFKYSVFQFHAAWDTMQSKFSFGADFFFPGDEWHKVDMGFGEIAS